MRQVWKPPQGVYTLGLFRSAQLNIDSFGPVWIMLGCSLNGRDPPEEAATSKLWCDPFVVWTRSHWSDTLFLRCFLEVLSKESFYSIIFTWYVAQNDCHDSEEMQILPARSEWRDKPMKKTKSLFYACKKTLHDLWPINRRQLSSSFLWIDFGSRDILPVSNRTKQVEKTHRVCQFINWFGPDNKL